MMKKMMTSMSTTKPRVIPLFLEGPADPDAFVWIVFDDADYIVQLKDLPTRTPAYPNATRDHEG